MALVKKKNFIPKCLKVFEKELMRELPDEAFEFEMINTAYRIVYRMIKHIKMSV